VEGENPKDKIDELQKELYERDFKSTLPSARQHFSEHPVEVNNEWQHPTYDNTGVPAKPPRIVAGSFFKKILIFSLIFFLVSAGLLVYMFYNGWNIISSNNVDITFLGPVTIAAGSELDFDVLVNNQNRSAIENATLYIDYPDGTKEVSDITKDLLHEKDVIGEVVSKSSARRTARSVLFGELNSQQEIRVKLEYGLKNANATYTKEKSYNVTISSTPLTITVEHPHDLISGDAVELTASVTSNSSTPLTNLLLKVDYPFGFSFTSADPAPSFDNDYWLIPSLNPGQTLSFTLRGTLLGEQNDERVFHYSIGSQNPENDKLIATRYFSQPESIFIQRPPVALAMTLDNSAAASVTTIQGTMIRGSIDVVNNLPVTVVDTSIHLVFSGPLYDRSSIQASNGFFQSSLNAIVWDKNTDSQLASLAPGEKVSLMFSFSTLSPTAGQFKNGTMTLNGTVNAHRSDDPDTAHLLSTSLSRTIQTQTSIGIIPQIVYSTGPFRNRGPIPPKVDTKTTYTVIMSAVNSLNDVRAGEVHATLPPYVTWNSDKNEVVWRVGDLAAGTGFSKTSRQVAFQIEFLPSLSQAHNSQTLVSDISLNAVDSFTNTSLLVKAKDLTTRLFADPQFNGNEANVVP
jgi:hypothetical protein